MKYLRLVLATSMLSCHLLIAQAAQRPTVKEVVWAFGGLSAICAFITVVAGLLAKGWVMQSFRFDMAWRKHTAREALKAVRDPNREFSERFANFVFAVASYSTGVLLTAAIVLFIASKFV